MLPRTRRAQSLLLSGHYNCRIGLTQHCDAQKYLETLALHHAVLRAAMKTKQTMNMEDAAALMKAIEALGACY